MKKILCTLVMMALLLPAIAQTQDEYYVVDSSKTQTKPILSKDRVHFSTDLGTSFSSFGKKNSCFSNYVAPQMNYDVSNRFTLSVGTMFVNRTLSYKSAESGLTKQNVFQNFVYVQGAYHATDRLTLTGSVLYETTSLVKRSSTANTSMNTSITSFGAEYKITDNIRVGIQIQQARGVSPFYNSMNNLYGW